MVFNQRKYLIYYFSLFGTTPIVQAWNNSSLLEFILWQVIRETSKGNTDSYVFRFDSHYSLWMLIIICVSLYLGVADFVDRNRQGLSIASAFLLSVVRP
jgi:hypothetical protein